ncbi:solute carrier family 40 member 1-like [Protopterus annectens]|uniref:solute carrier family 40 member 1-like n=1 Tax=Protopterus annectens TaxID=7888 RepID=UPI001CFB3807|nr:solute carrier family 40 member 1-like [Protopterus annectens]
MWQFAVSLFLVELHGNNLLLPAVFGLTVSSALVICGALVGNWIDRNPRLKVVRIALMIQNLSVILCAAILMMFFIYKAHIITIWKGWLAIICYISVIILGAVAELASTAMSISIQRDWIIVVAKGSSKLADMNATLRQIDLFSNLLAPMAVGQIMAFISSQVGCAFIAGWNLFSMCFEYLLLHKVYQMTPALEEKMISKTTEGRERHKKSPEGQTNVQEALWVDPNLCHEETPGGEGESMNKMRKKGCKDNCLIVSIQRPMQTTYFGWKAYYKQSVFLAGTGLSFLYMTVLGLDGITTGYAYAQGISSSILSIMVALSALTGLLGTVFFRLLKKSCGLIRTGCLSSIAQISCLLLCVASVFAPGSPLDLTVPRYIQEIMTADSNLSIAQADEPSTVLTTRLPGNSTANMKLQSQVSQQNFSNSARQGKEQSQISIILFFTGTVSARVGLWGFDLTVTQLLQEMVHESERGVVNGVQRSMNAVMNLLRFLMVIAAPRTEHFGILIIISVCFVSLGGLLYFCFARKSLKGGFCHTVCKLNELKSEEEAVAMG